MSAILLSVKPEFIYKIMNGEKRYEFRRRMCRKPVQHIYFYAVKPVQRVLARADVEEVIWDHPQKVWERTFKSAGVNREYFDRYFAGCKMAGAYFLGEVFCYEGGRELSEFGIRVPPQSFVYIEE